MLSDLLLYFCGNYESRCTGTRALGWYIFATDGIIHNSIWVIGARYRCRQTTIGTVSAKMNFVFIAIPPPAEEGVMRSLVGRTKC